MSDAIRQILLQSIPTTPLRVSTPELQAELRRAGHDLTARAVQKRLSALQDEHDLIRHDRSKPHQWSWPKGRKAKLFETMLPHQALSLLIARDHLAALLPPRTLQWIDDRLEKSESEIGTDPSGRPIRWRSMVKRVPHELPRIAPKVEPRIFRTVSEALYEGLQLSLRYHKRFEQTPQPYVVHPLGLCEREGELWLAARKQERDAPGELRFFLLHRMEEAKVLRGRPIVPPEGFDLERAIRDGRAHFPLELGAKVAIRVRFDPRVIEKLRESPLSTDQHVEQLSDGSFRLTATVPHTRALHTFLLGYGPLCVVESPKPLRDAIVTDLRQALASYDR